MSQSDRSSRRRHVVALSACALTLFIGATTFRTYAADEVAPTAETAPATFWDDGVVMAKAKADLAAGKGPKEALADLIKEANGALKGKPASVTDKSEPGPSGDMHDYVSYAPYFWPDPSKPDGKPFMNKDGHRNVEQIKKGNADGYKDTLWKIGTLGLAYYFTGDVKYADKAATFARVWFLDPATKMNPNFQYAQAILGQVDGRGIGLIENIGFVRALDGLTLIKGSGKWSDADDAAMHEWVTAFDKWMTTTPRGLDEKAAKNNHGSWYATQEAGLYLYLGQEDKAKQVFEAAKDRIGKQIEPDGKQPLEIVRVDGYGYSNYNAAALSNLATMAGRHGVDLWHYEKDGRSIKGAIDYLLPFANGEQKWTTSQLKKMSPYGMITVVLQAKNALGDPKYDAWLKTVDADDVKSSLTLLTGSGI